MQLISLLGLGLGPMGTLRRFKADDLLNFNSVNLDYFTETVGSA